MSSLKHSFFSNQESIDTHYFNLEAHELPGSYLKIRSVKLFGFASRYAPVLILKKPARPNSTHQSRYKWFLEGQTQFKSLAYPRHIIVSDVNKLIISNAGDGRAQDKWIFTKCTDMYTGESAFSEYQVFYIGNSYGEYLSLVENGREEQTLVLSTTPFKWRVYFRNRRFLQRSELEALDVEKSKSNEEPVVEPRMVGLTKSELAWFWDIACGLSMSTLQNKYDIRSMISKVEEFGNNGLMKAIVLKKEHIVMYILKMLKQEDSDELRNLVTHKNNYEQTVLHLAAYAGNITILQSLLDLNLVSCGERDIFGATPLMDAVKRNDSLQIVKLLLDTDPTVIDVTNKQGQNVFHIAAMRKNLQIFQLLLSVNCELVWKKDILGVTPLTYAEEFKQVEIASEILSLPKVRNNFIPTSIGTIKSSVERKRPIGNTQKSKK